MLQRLSIKNYALIDRLEMNFSGKMNIITGETGAGKSIILGGLSLMLGQRAESKSLFDPTQKCVVEGTFNIEGYQLQNFFETNELDYEPQTIVRREITPSGKSRAFINDTPVTLPQLKELTEQLVSLHAQHQTLHLYDANYHLFIIDTLANHEALLNDYKQKFKEFQKNKRQIAELETQYEQLQKDIDYVQFQLSELDEAAIDNPNEQDTLEKEQHQLDHAETIKRLIAESTFALEEQEISIVQQLKTVKSAIAEATRYMPELEELLNRLDSVAIELSDISTELSRTEDTLMLDPQRIEEINERLNILYRLQKKHRVATLAELMTIHADLASRNQSVDYLANQIEKLKKNLNQQQQKLLQLANQISANRTAQFAVLEQRIAEGLTQVGMPNARVKADHQTLPPDRLSPDGIDQIQLLFAPNKGSQFSELRRVASGGELSRLMLCIQSMIAARIALPTLIFDEIDTGISGEVALKVGAVLQNLGTNHQIICITHLPQIASKGEAHFFVYKDESTDRTISRIKPLDDNERITEVAKMLSGNPPTNAAIENARVLLKG
ncbi:MAG: DNA repair protein RecN [Sphingobacteriales bacterium]|nr:DNA repair protein RecN [Sphingobacteriales bacterium]